LVGHVLLKVMATRQSLSRDVLAVVAPDREHIVQPPHRRSLTPEDEQRTADAAADIHGVVLEVDTGTRPIVFAHPINALRCPRSAHPWSRELSVPAWTPRVPFRDPAPDAGS